MYRNITFIMMALCLSVPQSTICNENAKHKFPSKEHETRANIERWTASAIIGLFSATAACGFAQTHIMPEVKSQETKETLYNMGPALFTSVAAATAGITNWLIKKATYREMDLPFIRMKNPNSNTDVETDYKHQAVAEHLYSGKPLPEACCQNVHILTHNNIKSNNKLTISNEWHQIYARNTTLYKSIQNEINNPNGFNKIGYIVYGYAIPSGLARNICKDWFSRK